MDFFQDLALNAKRVRKKYKERSSMTDKEYIQNLETQYKQMKILAEEAIKQVVESTERIKDIYRQLYPNFNQMSHPTFNYTTSFLTRYNKFMSLKENDTIQENLVEMISQMRPDLSEMETEQCFHDTWNHIQEGGMDYAIKFIASWNRGGTDEEPY